MKINIFKLKKSFKKDNFNLGSNNYFRFIIVIAFGIMFVAFGFGLYTFKGIITESTEKIDKSSEQVESIKKEKIENILEYFADREKKSIEIINSPAPIIDPSL